MKTIHCAFSFYNNSDLGSDLHSHCDVWTFWRTHESCVCQKFQTYQFDLAKEAKDSQYLRKVCRNLICKSLMSISQFVLLSETVNTSVMTYTHNAMSNFFWQTHGITGKNFRVCRYGVSKTFMTTLHRTFWCLETIDLDNDLQFSCYLMLTSAFVRHASLLLMCLCPQWSCTPSNNICLNVCKTLINLNLSKWPKIR